MILENSNNSFFILKVKTSKNLGNQNLRGFDTPEIQNDFKLNI